MTRIFATCSWCGGPGDHKKGRVNQIFKEDKWLEPKHIYHKACISAFNKIIRVGERYEAKKKSKNKVKR